MLKSKVNELEIKNRLEPTANALLRHKYSAGALHQLEPGKNNAVGIGADKKLKFSVKAPGEMANVKGAVANPFNFMNDDGALKGISFKE